MICGNFFGWIKKESNKAPVPRPSALTAMKCLWAGWILLVRERVGCCGVFGQWYRLIFYAARTCCL